MSWKLILQLSMFGLAMGIATIFVIPARIEPLAWLLIFILCAYLIATRSPGRYFLHGLAVGLLNSVWITAAHILVFERYAENHRNEIDMMSSMPLADSPRLLMAVTGPVIGLISGVVLGLLAFSAARMVRTRRAPH